MFKVTILANFDIKSGFDTKERKFVNKNRSNGPVLLGTEEGWGWMGVSRGGDG